jgi:hypothetical protein
MIAIPTCSGRPGLNSTRLEETKPVYLGMLSVLVTLAAVLADADFVVGLTGGVSVLDDLNRFDGDSFCHALLSIEPCELFIGNGLTGAASFDVAKLTA